MTTTTFSAARIARIIQDWRTDESALQILALLVTVAELANDECSHAARDAARELKKEIRKYNRPF